MAEALTNWKNLSKYEYLGAYSLEGIVDEIVLNIEKVKGEKITSEGGKVDNCPVAYFKEKEKNGVVVKPMVLNKTNCKVITALYNTPFIENWANKKIKIYVQKNVQFGKKLTDALRIKNEVPSFTCSVCGKEIEESLYNGSTAKYGRAFCSKECLEKYESENANSQTTNETINQKENK